MIQSFITADRDEIGHRFSNVGPGQVWKRNLYKA